MEDVITETPPPSRFFEEDLDNFAAPSPPLPSPFLLVNPNPNPTLLRPRLLLVAISAPSLFLLHQIPNKTLIGTLILPEIPLSGNHLGPSPRDRSCNLYSSSVCAGTGIGTGTGESPSPAVLVAVQYPVSPERARSVAKSLLGGFQPETVVILDSIRSRNYRGRLLLDEALVFKLETSEMRRGGGDAAAREVEWLPSGSMMDGLGAAMLGECQMKRVKGTMVATWPKSGRPSPTPALRSLMKGLGLEVASSDGCEEDSAAGSRGLSRFDSDLYA